MSARRPIVAALGPFAPLARLAVSGHPEGIRMRIGRGSYVMVSVLDAAAG